MTSEPTGKRAKLESEPMCVVVHAFTDPDYSIYVYYLDLKLKEKDKIETTSLAPAIRILGETDDTSAVVSKSTLYIFNADGAYKYSLDSTEHCLDIKAGSESCQKLASMSYYKRNGVAVLIKADSRPKICFFSRTLYPDTRNFEVYDVETDTWCLLPEPVKHPPGGHSVAYFFVDGPKLFVNISGYSFAMDFSRIDGLKWEECFLNREIGSYHTPIVGDGDWAIVPHMKLVHMFDRYHGRRVPFHPYVSMKVIRGWSDDCVVRLPPEGGERLRACIVQLGVSDVETASPHILELYVLKFHGKKIIPDLVFSKSFTLAAESVFDFLWILGIFPMSSWA